MEKKKASFTLRESTIKDIKLFAFYQDERMSDLVEKAVIQYIDSLKEKQK